MFSLHSRYKYVVPNINLITQARYKFMDSSAKIKSKHCPTIRALNHFDDFYRSSFGTEWNSIREALLQKSKFFAVVNNYGDVEETKDMLAQRGAHCLNKLFSVQQEHNNQYKSQDIMSKPQNTSYKLEQFAHKAQSDINSNLYNNENPPEKIEVNVGIVRNNKAETLSRELNPLNETLDDSLTKVEMCPMSEVLYQFVPAAKLKGIDDWIPESVQYSYYSKSKDFPVTVEEETEFVFPEHLKVYSYEMDSETYRFPRPKRGKTGVYNYYPMDGSSVLAVLALCLVPGDRVLDLCAAPGGKSLVALQTLLPDFVICNDASISRSNRIKQVFNDYFYNYQTDPEWRERVRMSTVDGRDFTHETGFEKVLVDAPCTTDRHALRKYANNIFRPDRVKERLQLPEVQTQLLANALRLVKVGGAVVYSTCSLSPFQNDDVVHMALKQVFEENGIVATIKDLRIPLSGFSSTLVLGSGDLAPKYGQLVVPSLSANFGPGYISRLVRVR